MLTILFVILLIALSLAGLYGWLTRPFDRTVAITVSLFVTAGIGIAFGSYPIALSIAQRDAVGGYQQFLNTSIVSADSQTYDCTRDGPCESSYSCDPYQVMTGTDDKGNPTYTTFYHQCPYVSQEFSYWVTDAIGNRHVLGDHVFAADPQPWPEANVGIPGDVFRGVPPDWQRARDDLAAGIADPITVPDTYDNYLLASEDTILKAASDDIDRLTAAGLLPDHTANLDDPFYGLFQADKMQFVGFTPSDGSLWQTALMQFNAALGMEHQGDMHVVAIKASDLPQGVSSEDYLLALKAYWLNDLGKQAIAKNGIILVLGIDDAGRTIEWSRASTGMPVGNGAMLQALGNRLSDTPFSSESVFGTTTARVSGSSTNPEVSYTIGDGLVPQIVLEDFPFKRACMGCEGAEDAGQQGFVYLSTEIPLSGWGVFLTILADLPLLGLIAYGLLWFVSGIASNNRPDYSY